MKHFLLVLLGNLAMLNSRAADDWKVYYHDSGVTIEYRYADCHDAVNGIHQQKIFLKFTSTAKSAVQVTFNRNLQYQGQPASGGDHSYSLVLKAGETVEGDCDSHNKALYIFSKQLNTTGSVLNTFVLSNITVKPVN